jgi:hypothetical protein
MAFPHQKYILIRCYIAFFIDSRNHLKGVKGDRGEKGV